MAALTIVEARHMGQYVGEAAIWSSVVRSVGKSGYGTVPPRLCFGEAVAEVTAVSGKQDEAQL